jgi:site-specific DNA-methyltransferase (adenine-specific)
VFGIGITQITSLLARRSVYCSKFANGEHSIAESFTDEAGNIWFERTKHTWQGNKCKFCSAPKTILDRGDGVENYAYPFIHTDDIKTWIAEKFGGGMQFDVVIGNPPYQTKGGGGGINDTAIYQHFVETAMELNPAHVVMVIPSRWMSSGRGLEEFRRKILNDTRIRDVVDFLDTTAVFPKIQNQGGVCYFNWDRDHPGLCRFSLRHPSGAIETADRVLNEFDVLVRDNRALPILRKVLAAETEFVDGLASADTPFGLASNFSGWKREISAKVRLKFLHLVLGKRQWDFVSDDVVNKNRQVIHKWKVFVPLAGSGGSAIPDHVLGLPEIGGPSSVCSQTFRYCGPFESRKEAESFAAYFRARFFRFLVRLRKNSQNTYRDTYKWVPQQTWDREWTDKELYKKYKLTKEEIEFIESMIRPMEGDDE